MPQEPGIANALKFRRWYKEWAEMLGLNSDPYHPEHYYDYRAAYDAGVEPFYDPESGEFHWPSKFKLSGHPRLFIGGKDTRME